MIRFVADANLNDAIVSGCRRRELFLARGLKLITPTDYEELASGATELKRMLTALMQKLIAESVAFKISNIFG